MTECTWKEEKRNRAVLVGLNAYSLSAEDNATETTLEELAALLETAGGECVGVVLQNKDKPDARTFIGEGKVDEVRELAQAVEADLVVFDNEISPAQVRVLTEDMRHPGHGSGWPDFGHLRPAGTDERRPACRWRWRSINTCSPD